MAKLPRADIHKNSKSESSVLNTACGTWADVFTLYVLMYWSRLDLTQACAPFLLAGQVSKAQIRWLSEVWGRGKLEE